MIDIARALLAGGQVGDYQIGRDKTLSAVLLGAFGMSVPQFVQVVRDARTDHDVAERLWPTAAMPPEALSARLRRVCVSDVLMSCVRSFSDAMAVITPQTGSFSTFWMQMTAVLIRFSARPECRLLYSCCRLWQDLHTDTSHSIGFSADVSACILFVVYLRGTRSAIHATIAVAFIGLSRLFGSELRWLARIDSCY
jgi:hypothetical protein